jgi:hypothetical protein
MTGGDDLTSLTNAELVERAERLGLTNAATMGRDELLSSIRTLIPPPSARGGWLGRARDLVARVVERGLHMPDAAKILRGAPPSQPVPPPPLATVTLAEIYAAQGHFVKAIKVLDEVLEREPDHAEARKLRERYSGASMPAPPPAPPAAPDGPAAPEPAETVDAETAEPPTLVEDASSAATAGVDDVVCLATDPTTVYVYWELRPITFARARWRDARGKLVLRVSCFSPHAPATLDLDVDALTGDRFVRGLEPGSEVRICVAWVGPRGFTPLAVAAELQMPRDYRALARSLPTRPVELAAARRDALRSPDLPLQARPVELAAGARFRGYLAHDDAPASGTLPRVDVAMMFPAGEEPYRSSEPISYGAQGESLSPTSGYVPTYGGASDLFGGASDLSRRAHS